MINDSSFNYKQKNYSEKELIDMFIVDENMYINYHIIKTLFQNPFSNKDIKSYDGYYIYQNILRTELEFEKNAKPGDFDILIIPFSHNKIYFERTAVFEVKVVRALKKRPFKNANSLGTTQIWGLINDGFPLVGLIHFCLAEPLNDSEKQKLKYLGKMGDGAKITSENKEEEILVDFFACGVALNQMKRLISTDLPKYVGLSCFAVNTTLNDQLQLGINFYENTKFETGYYNPKKSQTTINKIRKFHSMNEYKCIIAKPHN